MSIDTEKIKKALDHFENDEYVESKDILSKEISTYKDEWLKDKLELKKNIEEGIISKFKNSREMIKLFPLLLNIEKDPVLSMEEKKDQALKVIKKSKLDPKAKKGFSKIMADQYDNALK